MQITITGIPEVFGAAAAAVERGVVVGSEAIGERGVGLVVEVTPVGATGNLANSIFAHLERNADLIKEIISAGPPADVYAAPVNDGSKPHFPPYRALIPWVMMKQGITDEKAARRRAYAIALKIAYAGVAANRNFDRAYQALEYEAQGIAERAIAEELKRAGF